MRKCFSLPAVILSAAFIISCSPAPPSPPPEQLESAVREILELPTFEQIYRDIVYVGEQQKVLFITTIDKEVLFAIDIRVQAGIRDAGLIDIEITGKNDDGTRTAEVFLPKSEILLVDADESSIRQYFLKEKGEEISRLEYYDEINRKKDTIVHSAVEAGLIEQADANARLLVRSFLSSADIEVTGFREAKNGN